MTVNHKCDILLVPPEINSVYLEGKQFMPLGILALASALRENQFNVKIYYPVHRLLKKSDFTNTARQILKLNPKYIGFSTWCNTFSSSLLLAKQLKLLNPQVKIIFGGPQASILPAEIIKEFSFVDFVLVGEADFTLPQLLSELKKKDCDYSVIQGLTYRNVNGKTLYNKEISLVPDLNKLPIPAYDLLTDIQIQKLDVGRGCPFQCTYCSTSNFFSKKYRIKSSERIIEEMEIAFERSNVTSFSFAHDLFTFNKKFVFDFCSKLIFYKTKKKRNFDWACSARIDCISLEMLSQMRAAGCHSIFFGIESGSEKIQKSIKKNLNLQLVLKTAEVCRQLNMKMYASFIIGFPNETKADIEKTLELIIKLACAGAQIQISELSLLPGTPLFKSYKNQLKYDGTFSNFSHAIIGKTELKMIKKYPAMFSSFYYLPMKSISRESIIILTRFINLLGKFRNTLFLIGNDVINDIEEYDLLHIFFQNKEELKQQFLSDNPNILILINLITLYLEYKYRGNLSEQIKQVFKWEARQNLLKDQYLKWTLYKSVLQKKNFINKVETKKINSMISTPGWDILFSNYDLQNIIPEKNGWIRQFKENKGENKFYYLLTVISNKNCKLLNINHNEFELLKILKQNSFELFFEKVKSSFSNQEMVKWLSYLEKNGVIVNKNLVK